MEYKNLGLCPICGREMLDDGKSVNRHHFVPKCRGGKVQEHVHTLCHNKIHSLWSEKELEREFSTVEAILSNESMQEFVRWVQKKDPLFYVSTKASKGKNSRR